VILSLAVAVDVSELQCTTLNRFGTSLRSSGILQAINATEPTNDFS
jgi:hypothetical protein